MSGAWGSYPWGSTSWAGPISTPVYFYALEHDVVVTDLLSIRNAISLMELVDDIVVDDDFRTHGQYYPVELEDDIAVTSQFNFIFLNKIEHDVNFSHSFGERRDVIRTLLDTLTIDSDFNTSLEYQTDTMLNLSSTFNRNVIYTKTLIESEIVISEFNALLFTSNPAHPVVSGIPIVYSNLVVLETVNGAIILPIPELSDTIRNTDEVTLRRAMSSYIFSYIKKGNTQAFSYTWLLDFTKAAELKAWLRLNMSQKITIHNWKGEIWKCDITSDIASFRAEAKYAGVARQKTSITVEFEGTKDNMKLIVSLNVAPLEVRHVLHDSEGTNGIKEMLSTVIRLLTQGNTRMGQLEDKISALVTSEEEAAQAQMDLDEKILKAIQDNQAGVKILADLHAADLVKIEESNAEIADLKAQVAAGSTDPETISKLEAAIQSNAVAIEKSKEQALRIDGINAFLATVLPPEVPVEPVDPITPPE